MTDNFTCIYKILRALEASMDLSSFNTEQISAEKLKISEERLTRYIEMLNDSGYIKGVRVFTDITGETCIEDNGIKITLKGLEYLTENSIMQRIYKATKGIKDILPL